MQTLVASAKDPPEGLGSRTSFRVSYRVGRNPGSPGAPPALTVGTLLHQLPVHRPPTLASPIIPHPASMPLRPGPGRRGPGRRIRGHGELPGATRASPIPVPERLPPAPIPGRARCSPEAGRARRVAALAEVLAEPGRSRGATPLSSVFWDIPDSRGVSVVPAPQRLRPGAGLPPAGGLRRGRPGRGAVGERARTPVSGGDLGSDANRGSGGYRGLPGDAQGSRVDARGNGGCGDCSGTRGRGGGRGPAVRSGRSRDCGPTYVRGSRDRGTGSRRRRRAGARGGGGRPCCAPRAPLLRAPSALGAAAPGAAAARRSGAGGSAHGAGGKPGQAGPGAAQSPGHPRRTRRRALGRRSAREPGFPAPRHGRPGLHRDTALVRGTGGTVRPCRSSPGTPGGFLGGAWSPQHPEAPRPCPSAAPVQGGWERCPRPPRSRCGVAAVCNQAVD